MDPIHLTVAALAFAGSCIAQKCADAGIDAAWARISTAYRRWRGGELVAQGLKDLEPASTKPDAVVLSEAEGIFALSTGLRRAQLVGTILRGAKILWVDDRPENNAWERSLLKAFDTNVVTVETTRSALATLQREHFDLILSDISREAQTDEGVLALPRIREAAHGAQIVFYVGNLPNSRAPAGAFGITNHPNELLHLILDALERVRV
jgi:CheY-like chemotaxis protein